MTRYAAHHLLASRLGEEIAGGTECEDLKAPTARPVIAWVNGPG